jgi:hypothetical protein
MFQANVGSGSGRATNYHNLLTKIVAFATSQGVDTVTVNAGGTGYSTGDVLTLSHAGGFLVARFEVTNQVGGVIQAGGLRITSNGAFANRATTATVSAAGTGYNVGDILEVQGGSNRCKAKFQVATLTGAAPNGVATVTLFEDGGAYSSTPSNPASATKIGPTAGTGSGCTLTVTYTGLIGTTGLAVTGGTGTGATVDITLAQTGATCERNTNSTTFNGVTNEKEVVLKFDATGRTNKPYVGFATGTTTSGINTRPFIALLGMIAHNPAISMATQPNILGDPGTFSDNRPYMCCDENAAQEMDFWITCDDFRIGGVFNNNSGAANTDDGQYMQWYAGFMDTFATESENPYPMLVAATSRSRNQDPSVSQISHSGLAECLAPTSGNSGTWYYRVETSAWTNVINSINFAVDTQAPNCMAPMAKLQQPTSNGGLTNLEYIAVTDGPLKIHVDIGSTGRAAATRRLLPIPGTTPHHFPIPLSVLSHPGTSTDQVLDTPRGQLRGFFWIYNTDSAGATIANFSEDYITIGSDRYRVFHNHMNTQVYNFICIKEDV